MDNRDVAARFEELADLLEFKGENPFKVRAYRRVARVLDDLSERVTELAAEGTLRELPGVGEATAKKIVEYIETGKITRLDQARKDVPPGLLAVLRIPGLGPQKAAQLHEELGVGSVEDLERAALAQKIRALAGMGEKTEQNILRGIRLARAGGERMELRAALRAAGAVIEELRSRRGLVSRVTAAGSLRRRCETIGDIDILACGPDAADILGTFTAGSHVAEVLVAGETKASVVTEQGSQVDLRVVDEAQFGAALQYFTGSKAHNIKLRGLARKRGMKINEYGLFKGSKVIASNEEEIYDALGMGWVPPELREDRGEIEAATEGTLPALVKPGDVRGDFHVHSEYSDGADSIEAVARSAKAREYAFVGITDHSQSTHIANGLDEERLRAQREEIAAVRRKIRGIRILAGTEVDIRPDGTLDFPDAVLAELDVVIAAIHSGFKQSRRAITDRLVAAARNPHVDILAHPTGRLIGRRDPYDVDVPELIRACAKHGTALEINAHPQRLDLTDVYCRMAKEQGVKLAIGADAHCADDLGLMDLGVAVARRGWLEKGDVLNTDGKPSFDKRRRR
jgi:DNA polymerase (family 10)